MQSIPTLGITIGDPAGIGPEIVLRALSEPTVHTEAHLIVIGSRALLEAQARHFGIAVAFDPSATRSTRDRIAVYDVPEPALDDWAFGEISAACGAASLAYLRAAVDLVQRGTIQGIVTGPLHKEAWKAASVPYPGHTEALGAMFGAHVETLFVVDQLRIFFLTRHFSLRDAIDHMTADRLVELARHAKGALGSMGLSSPTIAVAALNPHGGENGLFGTEEIDELIPGIAAARAEGIDLIGPIPADAVFHQAAEGRYDAVISLYHDQGHIAAKMRDFFRTVSVTTGLPVVRTSVDHGTAFDIAGRGIANPVSLTEAIRVAASWRVGAPSAPTPDS